MQHHRATPAERLTPHEQISSSLKRLKQGLLVSSLPITDRAYAELFAIGPPIVPFLLAELDKIDVSNPERGELVPLFMGLMTLLHDLDETVSRPFIDRVLAEGCISGVESGLTILKRHHSSRFRQTTVHGIEIWEQENIPESSRATEYVSRWLSNVPPGDLAGISRLYLVTSQPTFDFAGYYEHYLSLILIVWKAGPQKWSPLNWLERFLHEATLYHEVGHHFHQHAERGQVPEQEEEAVAYSRQIMRQQHPVLWFLVRGLRIAYNVLLRFAGRIVRGRLTRPPSGAQRR
ncbi:MAG: hypothetical protein AAF441_12785 [Pseudomonadota bacterium]